MSPSTTVADVVARGVPNAGAASYTQALPILVRYAIPVFVFLMPLMFWPGLMRPFSSPKLYAWCGFTLLLTVAFGLVGRFRQLQRHTSAVTLVSLLVACVGISSGMGASADLDALALLLTGVAWFVVLASAGDATCFAKPLAASSAAIAALALLQFAGLDPFQAAGWIGVGGSDARMRVYATLGNPNFVGAFLAGAMPLTVALALESTRRRWFVAAALLQGMAIAATGSRTAALSVCFAFALFFSWRGRRSWRTAWLVLAMGVVAVLLFGFSPARSLAETLQGRLYVWRVTQPQLSSIPVFGHGPGAFEGQFDAWQRSHFASPHNTADARFAAPFDHAHNDLLEWTVEYGWAGLAAVLACVAGFGASAWRAARASRLLWGAFAGIFALGFVSMADFPFHRPAELFLATTLLAMALGQKPDASSTGDAGS